MIRKKKLKGWWCHDAITLREHKGPWPCAKIKKCPTRDEPFDEYDTERENARTCGYGSRSKRPYGPVWR